MDGNMPNASPNHIFFKGGSGERHCEGRMQLAVNDH